MVLVDRLHLRCLFETAVITALASLLLGENAEEWFSAGFFFGLMLLLLHPQVVVNGLLEARLQDLFDNCKMCFVLMERSLDRPTVDLPSLYGMLAAVKKMTAAVQTFGWDWQALIVGGLATPVCLGVMFAYFILQAVGASLGNDDGMELNESSQVGGLLFVFFVLVFLFMCVCFLYTMWSLSCVAAATSKLKRLLDYALDQKLIPHPEARAIICEARYLIDRRGSVKLFGGEINRKFLFQTVRFMAKTLALLASVGIVGGSGAATKTDTGNATASSPP